jgi:hypothetical protein
MTPYEEWQLKIYGDILPESGAVDWKSEEGPSTSEIVYANQLEEIE